MTHSFSHYEQMSRQGQTALYLYIDIETIPSQDPAVLDAIRAKHMVAEPDLTAIEADKRLTDPAKIAADLEKKRVKAVEDYVDAVEKSKSDINTEYRRTALDASTGQIVCASAALADRDVHCIWAHDLSADAEKGMLQALFEGLESMLSEHAKDLALASLVEQGRSDIDSVRLEMQRHRVVPVVVAHHAGFDIRYIWQRAIILGVTPPSWWPVDARPWDTDRVFDTMTAWAGHGNRIGLDRLCKALSLPGKTGVDGSQVWDLVRDGRIDDVVDYCDDDVRRLRSVHRRLIGLPVLEIDAIEVPDMGAAEKEAA
ncbi:hypothetical protein [Devosia salina]|uniref:Predicted 3'-5' exonuclease PolB-like domain-containing protein n=1 Tax=Devosia salina TaxID=2860336 RepID=A0ABX8WH54_9HYPH|nr:hypothetical protein [Devosia salina]QYO75620.1 hypothetical protein K1X15_13370 [Devosia salina]